MRETKEQTCGAENCRKIFWENELDDYADYYRHYVPDGYFAFCPKLGGLKEGVTSEQLNKVRKRVFKIL